MVQTRRDHENERDGRTGRVNDLPLDALRFGFGIRTGEHGKEQRYQRKNDARTIHEESHFNGPIGFIGIDAASRSSVSTRPNQEFREVGRPILPYAASSP